MQYMRDYTKKDPKVQFGRQLRRLRVSKGLSQEALALAAGLDRTYVSGCERGTRNIGLENIIKLAEALSICPSVFFLSSEEE
ncbi:helix-turn-helix domain-containing protein [Vibrio breoganii]|uniref:helix-turn-helix domain-containing protein n=1 Tax=Vibrio breoganii TaxID=553239 RepID=UPI0025B58ABF|nr:helix-turn-helix transcriptional regulator [Vibrio breoganii]MDN3717432.1 helix-turn-helix transcriptional regulator [Vibrio breoganii]